MLTITKTFSFEAAHHLPNYEGKCARVHGHTYKLEVEIEGSLEKNGMIEDFGIVKHVVEKKVISYLDHQDLNNLIENPTAENTVLWVRDVLLKEFILIRVRLYETDNSYAEWKVKV